MEGLPIRKRHFDDLQHFKSHIWRDVSAKSLERKALSVTFLKDFLDKKPKHPKLVESSGGKISNILFSIPNYILIVENNHLWDVYQDLLLKLPGHSKITIITNEKASIQIDKWAKDVGLIHRVKLVVIPDYINISIWAEDAYTIVQDNITKENYFIEPNSFVRWEDGFIADFVSRELGWKRTQLPLYFEGGNMLVGDNFFLMGADYPIVSLKYIKDLISSRKSESKSRLITRLYQKYLDVHKKLIYVGSTLPVPSKQSNKFMLNGEEWEEFFFQKNEGGTVQPIFHIDMFISLAGRVKNGKYRLMIGDPRLATKILELPEVLKYAMAELFDNIARNMEKAGFEVIRNPLPLIYLDDTEKKERSWFFATSNNLMVEIIDETNKTVWMPTYGYGDWKVLQKTDDFNKKLWEDLGFKVILLGDFHPFIQNSGSLHCIKKYLERG
ncbi:MAG: hypothetical protein H0X62_00890 [Bacteroidetes bacterium]|nr:hypothetical protein [Bacteroidota bacterium]